MPKLQFHDHYHFLPSRERLSFEEIVRLSRLFAKLGVRKLRLTGGEPLLRANLSELIGDLSSIPVSTTLHSPPTACSWLSTRRTCTPMACGA